MSTEQRHPNLYTTSLDGSGHMDEMTQGSYQSESFVKTNMNERLRDTKPPLPKLRSLGTSVASSGQASPRSMAPSEAPSLATLSLARLALYRAGTRTFKPDTITERPGLSTGDVVALRIKGCYLAALPSQSTSDDDSIIYSLEPSSSIQPSNRATHLEIIRHDQWFGFRSTTAGDKILQARRKSPHRLVFFSSNLGTWEQWQVADGQLDTTPWKEASVTLRHRRLPHFELRVEMIRVGTTAMVHPSSSITPRSLPVVVEEDAVENHQVKRMSSVLVNEWMAFAEKERRLRSALEARVEQATTDIGDLKAWADLQVENVKREAGSELEKLVDALGEKTAELHDVQGRLTTRVQWGLQLMEARRAAFVKRQALIAWRMRTARAKYCASVESKLKERAALKTLTRVMAGWLDRVNEQRALQQRLRVAVRRMAYLKLYNAFTRWADTVSAQIDAREAEAYALYTAQRALDARKARRVIASWRRHSERCQRGRMLLDASAKRSAEHQRVAAFAAWRAETRRRAEGAASLTARCTASRSTDMLLRSLSAWRASTDDVHGDAAQLYHASRVLQRARCVRLIRRWRAWTQEAADIKRSVEAVFEEKQRNMTRQMFSVWHEFAWNRAEQRHLFVSFVHARAERHMQMALLFWQAHTRQERFLKAVARHQVLKTAAQCFDSWRHTATEAQAHRHMVDAFRKQRAHRTASKAFLAFAANSRKSLEEKALIQRAVKLRVKHLHAKVLAALSIALEERREYHATLESVAAQYQVRWMRAAFRAWKDETEQGLGWTAAQELARIKMDRVRMSVALTGWIAYRQQRQWERAIMHKLVERRAERMLASAFTSWRQRTFEMNRLEINLDECEALEAIELQEKTFTAWRESAAEAKYEDRIVAKATVKFEQKRVALFFSAWRRKVSLLSSGRELVAGMEEAHNAGLLRRCLVAWKECTDDSIRQRTNMVLFVERRATMIRLSALRGWFAYSQYKVERRRQTSMAVKKLALVRAGQVLSAWQQHTQDSLGEFCRLDVAGAKIAARYNLGLLRCTFGSWRAQVTRHATLESAIELAHTADKSAMVRCAFIAWVNFAQGERERRKRSVRTLLEKRCLTLQGNAFTAWVEHAQTEARYRLMTHRSVQKLAFKTAAYAFAAWRAAAAARKARRTALVRFMRRRNQNIASEIFAAWESVVAERKHAEEELKRCLIRKRMAFKQFKQWYWDSFDEDLQGTLKSMFHSETHVESTGDHFDSSYTHINDEALISEPPKSLLDSPIRRELQQARLAAAQEQTQDVGIAAAAKTTKSGSLVAATGSVANGDDTASNTKKKNNSVASWNSNTEALIKQVVAPTQQKHKLPLADRVAAALAAAQASPSPYISNNGAANLGRSAVLGSLQRYAGNFTAANTITGRPGSAASMTGNGNSNGGGQYTYAYNSAPPVPSPYAPLTTGMPVLSPVMEAPTSSATKQQQQQQSSSHLRPSSAGTSPATSFTSRPALAALSESATPTLVQLSSGGRSDLAGNVQHQQQYQKQHNEVITPVMNFRTVLPATAPGTVYKTPLSWSTPLSSAGNEMTPSAVDSYGNENEYIV